MRIGVFGANGQTRRLLTEQALAAGHCVDAALAARFQRDAYR